MNLFLTPWRWDAQGLDEFRHQAQKKTPLVLQTEACWQGKFQASVWNPLEEWFINVHNINWAIYIHLHQEKGWTKLMMVTRWWTNKKLLKMSIEIVDFPIKHGDCPLQNVSSPEGMFVSTKSQGTLMIKERFSMLSRPLRLGRKVAGGHNGGWWFQHSQEIWVNYNNSLTWIKAILGMISLTNHDFQWARSELVIIYPDKYESQSRNDEENNFEPSWFDQPVWDCHRTNLNHWRLVRLCIHTSRMLGECLSPPAAVCWGYGSLLSVKVSAAPVLQRLKTSWFTGPLCRWNAFQYLSLIAFQYLCVSRTL